jgi:ubiquinone/menaquinone biosynthesis C-methylase UbiE
MRAEEYDRWYETPRGRWIGKCETDLLCKELRLLPGESILDVGCGTGFFTRALAKLIQGRVVGVDIESDYVDYARRKDTEGSIYAVADARALTFKNISFDAQIGEDR